MNRRKFVTGLLSTPLLGVVGTAAGNVQQIPRVKAEWKCAWMDFGNIHGTSATAYIDGKRVSMGTRTLGARGHNVQHMIDLEEATLREWFIQKHGVALSGRPEWDGYTPCRWHVA